MSAPVYVIRVGQIRGEGDYYGLIDGAEGRAGAYRYMSWESAAEEIRDIPMLRDCRVVRVVVKPRQVVSLAHHIVCVATARLAALDEAEQACLEERRRCNMHASWGMASGARNCVAAIAALKVLP